MNAKLGRGLGRNMCTYINSPLERLVSIFGMGTPLMSLNMIVQDVVNGLSADKLTELQLSGFFEP